MCGSVGLSLHLSGGCLPLSQSLREDHCIIPIQAHCTASLALLVSSIWGSSLPPPEQLSDSASFLFSPPSEDLLPVCQQRQEWGCPAGLGLVRVAHQACVFQFLTSCIAAFARHTEAPARHLSQPAYINRCHWENLQAA